MNTHPYLRAFLAGVFVPTLILPIFLTVFIVIRLVMQVPIPIERAIIFPMALVPLLWGLWNMLWLASHSRSRLPIALHGTLLPVLLLPAGATAASCLGVLSLSAHSALWFNAYAVPYVHIASAFLCVLAGYYLVWKYVVGFLNRVLGIA